MQEGNAVRRYNTDEPRGPVLSEMSQAQKAKHCTAAGGEVGSGLMGTEVQFCTAQKCWRSVTHNINAHDTTELYTYNGLDGKFYVIYFLPRLLKQQSQVSFLVIFSQESSPWNDSRMERQGCTPRKELALSKLRIWSLLDEKGRALGVGGRSMNLSRGQAPAWSTLASVVILRQHQAPGACALIAPLRHQARMAAAAIIIVAPFNVCNRDRKKRGWFLRWHLASELILSPSQYHWGLIVTETYRKACKICLLNVTATKINLSTSTGVPT